MKKGKILVPLAIALVLIPVASLFAQQQPYKIAVVDSARAFQTSTEGKKAFAQFQERDSKIKSDIQRLEDAIRALGNRLNTGRLTMTQEALLATQADIDKKTTERKRYEEDATRDFAQFRDNLVKRIREEMIAIIDVLVKEKGYDIVLDLQASGVAYFNPAIDITEEIIRRYDISKAGAPPVKK
jgi:Skp family chaperone for outer membrane proteins